MDKLELIDLITNFHPASDVGIKKGWSYYVGGMKDSGDWYYKKLMQAPIEVLEQLLSELKEEWKPKDPVIYTQEEQEQMKQFVQIGKSHFMSVYELNQQKKFVKDQEKKLLGL